MWKIVVLGTLLFLISCKKRENSIRWNIDMSAPIAEGELSIYNILPDSVLQTETDSSVTINFQTNLYTLDLDSLVAIPDTVLLDTFALPFAFPVSFSPGQTFINQPEENSLEAADAELTLVTVKKGTIYYALTSTIQGNVIYEYQIPEAFDASGVPFSEIVSVPAPVTGGRTTVNGSFDLSGYTINLSGSSGNSFNKILTNVNVTVDPNNGTDIQTSNQDTLYVENTLSNISISYAKGYFGNQSFSISSRDRITAFDKITSGTIDIDQISIDFDFSNGAGVDGQFELDKISSIKNNGTQQNLAHSSIGVIKNINRAYETGTGIIPYNFSEEFNNTNSNIDVLLENLPDSLGLDVNLELNPLGNVSGHNDFISSDYPIKIDLGINMPISAIATNLTLTDTLLLDIPDDIDVHSGKFFLEIENGFPLGAVVDLALLDQNDMVIDHLFSPDEILSGNVDANGKVISSSQSSHTIEVGELSMTKLKANKKIVVLFTFNTATANHVNIYDYNKIKFVVKSDFAYGITIK